MSIPKGITREHVLAAIQRFDEGERPSDAGRSTEYDLVYEDRRYPPKAIMAMAAELATGRPLPAALFSGGKMAGGTNDFLHGLGFTVDLKPAAAGVAEPTTSTSLFRDCLRVLVGSPIPPGHLQLFKLLAEHSEEWTSSAVVEKTVFLQPEDGQFRGLMAALAVRVNTTGRETQTPAKPGTRLLFEDRTAATGRFDYRIRPDLLQALRAIPDLWAYLLDNSFDQIRTGGSRVFVLPPGLYLEPVPPTPRRWWLFQCNLEKYDLDGALKTMARTTWRMTRHAEEIAEGDGVFLWVSGSTGGLRAVATVDSPVVEDAKDGDPFIRDQEALSQKMKRVGIRFDDGSRLVPRDVVRSAPGLKDLGVLRSPQGTNYPVTSDEAQVLLRLYSGVEAGSSGSRTAARLTLPLNLILHGPPGTGKTYQMRAMREHFTLPTARTKSAARRDVADLTWFEVIAIALADLGRPAEAREVIRHPFVQAKYVERAPTTKLGPYVHATLQGHTVRESTTVRYERRTNPLVFDKDAQGRWFLPGGLPDDLREEEPDEPNAAAVQDNQFFVTFHPSFTYEDFVEGIRPESSDDGGPVRYPLRDGIFKQACKRAVQLAGFMGDFAEFCDLAPHERKRMLADARPAVLFVDEINRGNVARILGELITLIEPDKRLGADQELIVTLPGSRQRFGVPSNLWIVGTMNTADRSVVALDVALRRRFAFAECPPRPELLEGVVVDGVDVVKLLGTINRRLLALRDRDHLIGHAFFLPLKATPTLDALRRVFRESVLPLLLEYFHDDLGRVGLVLGPSWVRRVAGTDVFAKGFDHDHRDDLADRPVWEIAAVDALPIEAFRDIDG